MTFRLLSLAIVSISSTSQAFPNTCTGTIALVLLVITFIMFSELMFKVSGFISANIGSKKSLNLKCGLY